MFLKNSSKRFEQISQKMYRDRKTVRDHWFQTAVLGFFFKEMNNSKASHPK